MTILDERVTLISVMRVISRSTLRDFWETHPDAEGPLSAWFREAKSAAWKTTSDIKRQFVSASFLADRIVIFNIGGNKYRLVVQVLFETQVVFIRFVGTHQEYDERNKRGW